MKWLLSIALIFNSVSGGADSGDNSSPLTIVLAKPAAMLHPEFVRNFEASYDRATLEQMGRDNVMEPEILQSLMDTILNLDPSLGNLNQKILATFLLRTDLFLRLVKNGFIEAAGREFEFFLGETGELTTAIDIAVRNRTKSAELAQQVMEMALRRSIESYSFLRPAERERLINVLEQSMLLLKNKKFLKSLAKNQRQPLLRRNLKNRTLMAVGYFAVMTTMLIALDYTNRKYSVNRQLIELMAFGDIYSWGGFEMAGLINFFRSRFKLLEPWRVKEMATLRNVCEKLLSELKGTP